MFALGTDRRKVLEDRMLSCPRRREARKRLEPIFRENLDVGGQG